MHGTVADACIVAEADGGGIRQGVDEYGFGGRGGAIVFRYGEVECTADILRNGETVVVVGGGAERDVGTGG